MSLSINLGLIFWNIALRKKNKLEAKFGVYWDSELNPYCPICKTLLILEDLPVTETIRSKFSLLSEKPCLYCSKCDKYFSLRNDYGLPMSLGDAKKY